MGLSALPQPLLEHHCISNRFNDAHYINRLNKAIMYVQYWFINHFNLVI